MKKLFIYERIINKKEKKCSDIGSILQLRQSYGKIVLFKNMTSDPYNIHVWRLGFFERAGLGAYQFRKKMIL